MTYKLLFLFITLFISQSLFALSGSIRGKATERATGKNIIGAQIWVTVSKTNKITAQAITDTDGNFVIENLDNGTYDLECIAAGQITQRIIGLQITNNAIRLAYFKMNSNKGITTNRGGAVAYRDSVELIYTYASLQALQTAETKTATASSQTLLDQPATGYLISAEDIVFRGYMSLLDVLRDVPEIELNENSLSDYLNIVSSRGSVGSGRWLIMQNGIRINTMMGSDVVIANNVNIRHASKIEIVIGAASAVYGADAFSGVINIITKSANTINGVEVISSFGSFQETNSALTVAVKKGEFSMLANGSFFATQAPNYPKLYPQEYAYYNNNYITNGAVMTSAEDTTPLVLNEAIQPFAMPATSRNINLLFQYKNLSFGSSHFYESHSSNTSSRPELSPPEKASQYSTVLNNAFIQHNLAKQRWSLNTIIQFNYWHINPKTNYKDNISTYQRTYKYGYEGSGFARSIFNYQISKTQQLTAGISAQYSHVLAETADLIRPWQVGKSPAEQNLVYTGSDTTTYDGRDLSIPVNYYFENRAAAGTFVQYQINVAKKLAVIAGGRYDFINNKDISNEDNKLYNYSTGNFRAGLVYKPTENWRIKLFSGSAFLAPSPNKVLNHYGAFTPTYDSLNRINGLTPEFWKLPTTALTGLADKPLPEKLYSVELSTIYTKNNFLMTANGFYNRFNKIIRNDYFDSVAYFVNTPSIPLVQLAVSNGDGFAYGATVALQYKYDFREFVNIRFNAAYSFVNGQITDPDGLHYTPLYFTAQNTIKSGVGLQYKQFSVYINCLYRTPSYQEPTEENEVITQLSNLSFFTFSAFANYQIAAVDKGRFAIDVFVRSRNLLNAKYYHTGLLNPIGFVGVPQQPFGIWGGVSLRFNR